MQTERFKTAIEQGEITHKDGYHQPDRTMPYCGCEKTTGKGAYRDTTVQMPDGRVIHYYHQTPVVVKKDGKARLDNGGYHTRTTKQRINSYLPGGFRLYQEDFEWYISTPEGEIVPFENGMIIGD